MAKASGKKTGLYIGLAVLAVLIVAGGFMFFTKGVNPLTNPAAVLTGGASMKCEYTEDGRNIVAYVKGEQFRTDVTGGEEGSMSMIYKDDTTWSWNTDTKKGMKMTFEKPTVTPGAEMESTGGETEKSDAQEIKEELDKYKDSCKNQMVSESLFTPPSDVEFQDYSQMMEQMQNMNPQSVQNMSEEQLQEMMQQYMPQQ